MHDNSQSPVGEEEWVVWNGTAAILTMAALGRIELSPSGRLAWLAPPFGMVGPFNLDELEANGRIAFEACLIMSRQRWQDDQVVLRQEAYAKRRAAQERLHAEHARAQRRSHGGSLWRDERQHRAALNLPADGELRPADIKAAFRKLAQKAHPDVGGSHDAFLRIIQARDALLESA